MTFSFSERIGPFMLPDLPLAACKGDYAFTSRSVDARRAVCTGCPESARCLFSLVPGVHPDGRSREARGARLTDPTRVRTVGAHRALSTKQCESCGNTFRGHGRSRYCSRECAKRRQCGTNAGINAHSKNGERACSHCLAHQRESRAHRKEAA